MPLLIVESPGKIKKLKSFLGPSWEVLASVGHVRDLPAKDMGVQIAPDRVRLVFEFNQDKEQVIKNLQNAAKRQSEILLAMDPDREGEAIAYHVGIVLGKEHWSKIKRVSFNEITESALKRALSAPRRVDMNLVHAQQARRVVDRLVGYRVSPLLWKQANVGTSAGRVQSVAVRLIVEREREIRNFVPQEYWNIEALLSTNSDQVNFNARLVKFDSRQIVARIEEGKEKQQLIIESEQAASAICQVVEPGPWKVKKKKLSPQKRKPYPPFVTSSLQQAAHTQLNWSADKTMKVAQSLYEKGLITYMRTDSPSVSKEALKEVRGYISESFGQDYLPDRAHVYKAKDQRSQEAHECVRPVMVARSAQSLNGSTTEEIKLYDMIWRYFVASQMSEAIYDTGILLITAPRSEFEVKGRRLVFDGWIRLLKDNSKTSQGLKSAEEPLLPPLEEGDELRCCSLSPLKSFTKPPPRYSEARLIKSLEVRSIGRPSTYAAILSNIKKRGYVSEESRVFHATEVGERLVDFLLQRFEQSFMDVGFTATMEDDLDRIAYGDKNWETFVRAFHGELDRLLGPDPRVLVVNGETECPKCSLSLRVRQGRNGLFVGCSGYPNCSYTRPLNGQEAAQQGGTNLGSHKQ